MMLDFIWSGMIIAGCIWGLIHGTLPEITQGLILSAREAVEIGIAGAGMMSFWTGILNVAEQSGLVECMAAGLDFILDFLYPGLPKGHPARKHIAMNAIANILGMGSAATPEGILAMQELKKELPLKQREQASGEMCTFLVMNISSLQLIPVNIIAYRSRYNSVNPAAVTGPALVATTVSTMAGVFFCCLMNRKKYKRN